MKPSWISDLTYAVRSLLRAPVFSVLVVLILGLAIGANGAIFSLVDQIVLRPLPYPQPDRLVGVWESNAERGLATNDVAPGNWLDWLSQARGFERLSAWFAAPATLTTEAEYPERVDVGVVWPGWFELLGAVPVKGRTFREEESEPGRDHVVILGHGLWQQRFGGKPDVVGSSLSIDGETYQIVGVAPPGFDQPQKPDLWIPLALPAEERTNRGSHFLKVVGRLAPGVTVAGARQEMIALADRLASEYPETNRGWSAAVVPLHQQTVGDVRPMLLLFQAAVLVLLLIACLNVANLLLVRTTARGRDLALRSAVGAGRVAIVRQVLTESLVLSAAGGLVGLVLARAGLALTVAFKGDDLPRLGEVRLDASVIAFTLGVTLLTGLVAGLLPALRAARPDLNAMLKEGERKMAGRGGRLRQGLIVAEVGLAVVLLVGAGLLVDSFLRLSRVDTGIDPHNVLTMRMYLPDTRYPDLPARHAFYESLLEEVSALPGVRTAGLVSDLPVSGVEGLWRNGFELAGRSPASKADQLFAYLRWVSPGYFGTLGLRVERGRDVDESDGPGRRRVVVVDRAFVDRFLAERDPIGERLVVQLGDEEPWEIVGIVDNVRQATLAEAPEPHIYMPYRQAPFIPTMTLAVRTAKDPLSLAGPVRDRVFSLDDQLAPYRIQTMEEQVAGSIGDERFNTLLIGAFATVALLLAALGLYGLIAYSVARRTQEFGIRAALGARERDILLGVLRQGLVLAGMGLVIGVGAAVGLTRMLKGFLYEVQPTDPWSYLAVAVVLTLVALIASFVPARRAARIDPKAALQYE